MKYKYFLIFLILSDFNDKKKIMVKVFICKIWVKVFLGWVFCEVKFLDILFWFKYRLRNFSFDMR